MNHLIRRFNRPRIVDRVTAVSRKVGISKFDHAAVSVRRARKRTPRVFNQTDQGFIFAFLRTNANNFDSRDRATHVTWVVTLTLANMINSFLAQG